MTLIDVHEMFSGDARCRELLKRLRWPLGPECPRCKGKAIPLETAKDLLYCKDCDYQFTATSGTIFHDSHLPLIKWFTAVYLLCESRKGMSANQIKRMLGVSYKTAWYLCHRIRAAMKIVDAPMLDGKIEMDETFVGGRRRARGKQKYAGDTKEIVIGIRQRGGSLRLFHPDDVRAGTLAKYIRQNVSKDVEVFITDDWSAYNPAVAVNMPSSKHKTINHSSRVYVQGDVHTNTIESAFSLLKRGIVGTWHSISAKHLQAYLDEMTFRFDRRNSPDLFVDTLRYMVTADPLTFAKLTADPKLKVA
ncbi:MAG: IS1595 family transposase [Pyrinomonadaceae bacterium]